jgi:ABC-type transport system involved in multi-copper enzyme maturation permease subunit
VLPIVQRELQTAARNPKLYRGRLLGWLAVLFIVAVVVPFHGRSRGSEVFQFLANLTLFLCLLEGVRKTADAISSERREGTLGLLFLSTLSGWDIILGKLTSAAIRSFSTLLIFVPVLAVTLLLGGTTGGEFWRSILILVLTLVMSLSVCLCLSALTRESAISACFVFLFFLCLLPNLSVFANELAPWILPLSPFRALKNASDMSYLLDAPAYWRGIIYLIVLAMLALSVSSFVLPQLWQDKPIKARANQRVIGKLSPRLAARRRAMLDRNPIMWLMFNPRSHHQYRLLLLAIVAFVIIGSGAVIFVAPRMGFGDLSGAEWFFPSFALIALAFITSIRVARDTSRNFAEARANGALELMLSTPLKVREIISGQWQALRADLFPALIVFVILSGLTLLWSLVTAEGEPTLIAIKLMLEVLLGIPTIAAVGIWMGLSSKSPGRAFFKTVAIAFIGPHLVCTPTLVNQLVLLLVALDKIHVHFRRFVAEQYLANRTFLSAVAFAPPNTPPVIRR